MSLKNRSPSRLRKGLLWSAAISMGGLLVLGAVALQPILREANYLVEKLRYTSLCTRCGRQDTEVFYLMLGSEVIRTEKRLPVSSATALHQTPQNHCSHSTVLIGKTSFGISKNFDVDRAEAGAPSGWDFRGMDLARTVSELEGMRTGAVLGHMHALVKARERGDRVTPSLLSDAI
jgi:hypothetical protein